jgi:hypothetical protein
VRSVEGFSRRSDEIERSNEFFKELKLEELKLRS